MDIVSNIEILARGAFPVKRSDSLINHHGTMHCCGNKDLVTTVSQMTSHVCGGVIASAI